MRKPIRSIMWLLALPVLLSGCIIVPWDSGYGEDHYSRGGHRGGYDRGYDRGYDGRR
jgi:hypothetical protein